MYFLYFLRLQVSSESTDDDQHTLAGTAACEDGGRVHGSRANTTGISATRSLHYF